jgi:lysylphosphatidylglycerol synthetase-like protein (DUF2156 family)
VKGPSVSLALRVASRDRVVVHVDSPAARWTGVSTLAILLCWIVVLHKDMAWSLTMLTAVALIARGIFLNRPVTAAHAWLAGTMLLFGLAAQILMFDALGSGLIVAAAAVLVWPTTARPDPDDAQRIWSLVDATVSDPLAAFAMHSLKCHYFSADGTAAIAYRTRLGYAVVSGDPIGDPRLFRDLVADFAAMCHTRGWRIVVLACSERRVELWTDRSLLGKSLFAVPVGRDVVLDVTTFDMVGRKYRNLRQAVQRTRNAGITTEVVEERGLDGRQLSELTELLGCCPKGGRFDRGFAMCIDGMLTGRYPGIQLIIARDKEGRVQGLQRYATAGHGSEVSLDVPWRRRGAPNGIDERLSVDMVHWARDNGAQRLSLAFAAFPEIFSDSDRGKIGGLIYAAIHLGDRLIALESLYRYLRKFRTLGERRYVLLSLTQTLPLLVILLWLEFAPRRRRL